MAVGNDVGVSPSPCPYLGEDVSPPCEMPRPVKNMVADLCSNVGRGNENTFDVIEEAIDRAHADAEVVGVGSYRTVIAYRPKRGRSRSCVVKVVNLPEGAVPTHLRGTRFAMSPQESTGKELANWHSVCGTPVEQYFAPVLGTDETWGECWTVAPRAAVAGGGLTEEEAAKIAERLDNILFDSGWSCGDLEFPNVGVLSGPGGTQRDVVVDYGDGLYCHARSRHKNPVHGLVAVGHGG